VREHPSCPQLQPWELRSLLLLHQSLHPSHHLLLRVLLRCCCPNRHHHLLLRHRCRPSSLQVQLMSRQTHSCMGTREWEAATSRELSFRSRLSNNM
jgi:hypothetical protein